MGHPSDGASEDRRISRAANGADDWEPCSLESRRRGCADRRSHGLAEPADSELADRGCGGSGIDSQYSIFWVAWDEVFAGRSWFGYAPVVSLCSVACVWVWGLEAGGGFGGDSGRGSAVAGVLCGGGCGCWGCARDGDLAGAGWAGLWEDLGGFFGAGCGSGVAVRDFSGVTVD